MHIWNTSKFEDEENRNKKMMGNQAENIRLFFDLFSKEPEDMIILIMDDINFYFQTSNSIGGFRGSYDIMTRIKKLIEGIL